MKAIIHEYQKDFHRPLETAVRDDLSGKMERLYTMVLKANRAEEAAQPIPQQIEQDVTEIYKATEGKTGTDELTVCSIFATRNRNQVRAISLEYQRKYARSLEQVLLSEFSGHMEDALVRILRLSEDAAKADATALEHSVSLENGSGC